MTAVDVLGRALELSHSRQFDCPYCALALAKTELDAGVAIDGGNLGEALEYVGETLEILRQFMVQKVEPLPSDVPLEDACEALSPYSEEIGPCPSPITAERLQEMLALSLITAQAGRASS